MFKYKEKKISAEMKRAFAQKINLFCYFGLLWDLYRG